MFGCLRKLGCLAVLLVAGALYLGRDWWWPSVRERMRAEPVEVGRAGSATGGWQSLDQDKAVRGERAVRALSAARGPVYVNLEAGELASYTFLSLTDKLPFPVDGAQAAVIGDRVYVRSPVSLRDLGGALGSVGSLLPDRDTLRLGGTFEVVRPGLAQFRVRDVQVGSVPVPLAVVPRLLRSVGGGSRRGRASGVAEDAIAIPIPRYIGDVRVARGRITLYKSTP